MPVRTRRWNDPAEEGDGLRVLICRYRPRGVAKAAETWEVWCPHLGPSQALHAAYFGKAGPPITFDAYRARFLEEMKGQGVWLEAFAERLRRGETVTLLCSSACVDPDRCHRTLVASLLEARAAPPAPPAEPRAVRKRTR